MTVRHSKRCRVEAFIFIEAPGSFYGGPIKEFGRRLERDIEPYYSQEPV
jgi:hypothetical protein